MEQLWPTGLEFDAKVKIPETYKHTHTVYVCVCVFIPDLLVFEVPVRLLNDTFFMVYYILMTFSVCFSFRGQHSPSENSFSPDGLRTDGP